MLPRPAVVLHWTGVAAAFLFFIIIAESSNNSQALFMLIVKFPSLFIQILFFFFLNIFICWLWIIIRRSNAAKPVWRRTVIVSVSALNA